jgi:hypothetical protein
MIVATYQFGNTKVEIDDSAFVRTQAEIDRILKRIAKIASARTSDSKSA